MNDARWVRITDADSIPLREGRAAVVGGREIAIFNLGDRLRRGRQPLPAPGRPAVRRHRRRRSVVCPLHAWKINLRDRAPSSGPQAHGDCVRTLSSARRGGRRARRVAGASDPAGDTRRRRHDGRSANGFLQSGHSADARRGAALLRRQLHGLGAARPARAVPARGARAVGDAAGAAVGDPAARRVALPPDPRRARRSHRRPPHRPDRPGADARRRCSLGWQWARRRRRTSTCSDSCSGLPARASRWRCRWRAAGIRRSIRGWRWASPAPATPGSLLATLFAPRLAERFGWANDVRPRDAAGGRASSIAVRAAREGQPDAAARRRRWRDYWRGAAGARHALVLRFSTA